MSDTEVGIVAHLVDLYNSDRVVRFRESVKLGRLQPEPSPPADDQGSTSEALGNAPDPCVPHISFSFYWWGFRIHMDHCFCSMLKPIGQGAASLAASVGAILATFKIATDAAVAAAGAGAAAAGGGVAAAGPWIALAAGLIATMLGWIAWADGYCTPNSGANYNQTWTVQGWITTVC
jgi:hypothetical protein